MAALTESKKGKTNIEESEKKFKSSNSDIQQVYSDMPTLLVLAVLKNFSSAEHPLNSSEILEKIVALYGLDIRTLRRKLVGLELITDVGRKYQNSADIFEYQEDNADEDSFEEELLNYCIAQTIRITCNGSIRVVQEKEGGHKKYYFEPLLNESYMDMLESSIISNQYLSEKEQQYLIRTLSTLGSVACLNPDDPAIDLEEVCNALPPADIKPAKNPAYPLLKQINLLYRAVTEGWQIEIVYGEYRQAHGKNYPVLMPKKKAYHLHPYALFFNDGNHYLLATHDGHDNPAHFRVDRIYSAKILRDPEDARLPLKRAPRPASLRPFFTSKGFQQEKYTDTYPLMSIYQETKITECTLQCAQQELAIVIDTFGKKNVRMKSAPTDAAPFYQIAVKAQYESLVLFCTQQHMTTTILSPKELICDVRERLMESVRKYENA